MSFLKMGVRHEARTDDGPDSAGQGVTVRAGSERDRAARRVCTAQAHAVSLPAGDRPGKVTGKAMANAAPSGDPGNR